MRAGRDFAPVQMPLVTRHGVILREKVKNERGGGGKGAEWIKALRHISRGYPRKRFRDARVIWTRRFYSLVRGDQTAAPCQTDADCPSYPFGLLSRGMKFRRVSRDTSQTQFPTRTSEVCISKNNCIPCKKNK